ncbi:hypothetical protein NDU88_000157 [Pleurodeles waltl]|uniref:Uncharacterized protein n=1 Tax=Pleurodeles waltl TaxID=8319 RepID=A0AAV7TFG2_PLEWA|nr:hypothetical protein NDU88_000157 [Pleurodeles waltl]
MARVTGERVPAFISVELEQLDDGVLSPYGLLYGPPDQQHHLVEEQRHRRRRASHRILEAESTDGEGTSGTEGEGRTTDWRGQFRHRSLLRWELPGSGGHLCDHPRYRYSRHPCTSTALPAAPQRVTRARSPRKVGISFAPGTSGPAPVGPAALSEEAIVLLRPISVGQSTIVYAIQGLAAQMQQTNAFLEVMHTGLVAQQRASKDLASSVMAEYKKQENELQPMFSTIKIIRKTEKQ